MATKLWKVWYCVSDFAVVKADTEDEAVDKADEQMGDDFLKYVELGGCRELDSDEEAEWIAENGC